jgi:signal transduction histidine kinase
MNSLHSLFNWFAGNGLYMRLTHCMGHDTPWIWTTVLLDAAVATGYGLIAWHWWTNSKNLPDGAPAKKALGNMRNIFLFCGICGYAFIPIKMVWPAWRLYDLFMAALVYFTWKYAWSAKDLKVVYRELGRSSRLEADLEATREESRRKSAFLNALSHDLRTPLNGVLLQANFAELNIQAGDPKSAADALREIKQCTRATAELLDSLLEYAKVDWSDAANTMVTFELGSVIDEVAGRCRAEADQKQLCLKIGTSARGIHVHTDKVKLERILQNLLSNAVKFTDSGGVRVEAQRASNGGIEIHVIDSGIGIEPHLRDHLFDEFFQVKNHARDRRKGFGLGLAIAKRLARHLGGEISVESAVDTGSRFSVVLPGVVVSHELGADRVVVDGVSGALAARGDGGGAAGLIPSAR